MNNDEVTLEDLHFGHLDQRQITSADWVDGKRAAPVKALSLDHWMGMAILHFDDGKFIILEIDDNYGEQRITVKMVRPSAQDLTYFDLVTDEEYDTYLADKKSRETATADERRRVLYERLRAEFEGDDDAKD